MKLVAGLGNPGVRYQNTRHNAGYRVLAEVAGRSPGCTPKSRFHGDLAVWQSGGESVLLLAPATFMNRSGTSVGEAAGFYKIPAENILIVCDDLNLPANHLRFRGGGSSGGQKGLADIIRVLGTDRIPRLRVGIGQPPGQMDAADYVLMNLKESEKTDWEITIKTAADAVICWVEHGLDTAMNRYNTSKKNKLDSLEPKPH